MAAPIPRVLHQTWKNRQVPEAWRAFHASWRRHHPAWELRLWTDEDNRRLVAERHPGFLATYDGFARDIQRVDAAKYFLLYTHGGVYADLDCECLRPVDPLLEAGGAVVARTPDGVIDAAFLASSPGHPFWEEAFREMRSPPWSARVLRGVPGFEASHVLLSTGPQMLRRAVRSYQARARREDLPPLAVLAPRSVSGRSWLRRHEPFADDGEAFVRHHHSDSWLRADERAVVRFFTAGALRAAVAGLVVAAAALALWWLL